MSGARLTTSRRAGPSGAGPQVTGRRWRRSVSVLAVALVGVAGVVTRDQPAAPSPAAAAPCASEAELALLLALAEDAWRRDDLEGAAGFLSRGDASGATPALRTRRAGLALRLGEVALARTEVEASLRQAPDDVDALLLAARLAAARGDVAAVGTHLQRAARRRPTRADVCFALSRHDRARGDREAARRWVDEGRRAAGGDGAMTLEAAELLAELGDAVAAERLLVEAASDRAVGHVAAARLGALVLQADRWDDAERWLRRSLVPGSADVSAHAPGDEALVRATLARLVVRRDGSLDEAAGHASRAAALAPDGPDVWKALGCVARARGDLDEAFSRYDAVARACPTDVEAHEALSALYRRWGLAEQALQHARLAIAARADLPGPYVTLSRALRRAGDDDGAADAARGALARVARHAPALAALSASVADGASGDAPLSPFVRDLDAEGVADLALGLARSGQADRARVLLSERRTRCTSAFGRAVLDEARLEVVAARGGGR